MDASTNFVAYGLIVVLTPAMLYGFRRIFSLDHDVEPKEGAIVVPIRAMGRAFELMFAAFGAVSIVSGFIQFLDGNNNGIWAIPFGFAFSLFGSYMTNTHLWLDEVGMHYRKGLGTPRVIEWRDLDHYEQTVVRGRNAATRYFLFRSKDGTTFWISKTTYDINKLLDLIRSHAAIDEKPYVSQ